MKVLNLYAGIGGNRKLWEDVDVVAVEIDPKIAKVYQDNFPDDEMVVGDAHHFLLENFGDFDFIWSSPPCPTHSDIRRAGVHGGKTDLKAVYPEMQLYAEILLLQHFAPLDSKWVVENVRSYYEPLIKPTLIERHYMWSNFPLSEPVIQSRRIHNDIKGTSTVYGFNIKDTDIENKRAVMRNLINPKLGLHIFNCAFKVRQTQLISSKR